ncbi:hypothetical protein [Sorangium sp. So ce1153]|uniref:hypothetical protein n=1 Tax=Sorangium sp. So ce1153 TaxID=3133333 RepID=UPI003F629541
MGGAGADSGAGAGELGELDMRDEGGDDALVPASGRDEDDEAAAERGAPHGVTLIDHAQMSAELAEGDRALARVLETRGLTEAQWNESTLYWMQRMGDDVMDHAERARIPIVYSDFFAKAQDALKPLPAMDVEGYATLVAAIQAAGSPAQPLAARGLSTADYLRLSRHFARAMAADTELARRFFEVLQALAPPADEVEV